MWHPRDEQIPGTQGRGLWAPTLNYTYSLIWDVMWSWACCWHSGQRMDVIKWVTDEASLCSMTECTCCWVRDTYCYTWENWTKNSCVMNPSFLGSVIVKITAWGYSWIEWPLLTWGPKLTLRVVRFPPKCCAKPPRQEWWESQDQCMHVSMSCYRMNPATKAAACSEKQRMEIKKRPKDVLNVWHREWEPKANARDRLPRDRGCVLWEPWPLVGVQPELRFSTSSK